jgi:hypothetical protein
VNEFMDTLDSALTFATLNRRGSRPTRSLQ